MFKVLGELEGRGYTTTVYVTGSFAENNGHIIQEIQEHGHDIAFHGWATGENLTTLNYSMQQKILINAKNSVENYSGYQWRFVFSDLITNEFSLAKVLRQGDVEDILIVFTLSGTRPAWH